MKQTIFTDGQMKLSLNPNGLNDWTWQGLTEEKLLTILTAITEYAHKGHPVAYDILRFLEDNMPKAQEG